MEVKFDDPHLQHFRFPSNIARITSSIRRNGCWSNLIKLNLDKTMFMRNGRVSDGFRCPIHAKRNKHMRMLQLCISRSRNQHTEGLTSELGRRKRTAWGAFKTIDDVVERAENIRLHAHLFTTPYSKLIEVSRECKMPLCLTFIDLKKASDTVKTVETEGLGQPRRPYSIHKDTS
ncbi:hypothetical protein RB195_014344 [Necator americanus]|uniref:Uncharacterized protein n=1 Tax=Necator americanus TaxID=51031 RepID=A0ABR1DZR9_NECAM